MELTWSTITGGSWRADGPGGEFVAQVAECVTGGGEARYWTGWVRGHDVGLGEFETREDAMAAAYAVAQLPAPPPKVKPPEVKAKRWRRVANTPD